MKDNPWISIITILISLTSALSAFLSYKANKPKIHFIDKVKFHTEDIFPGEIKLVANKNGKVLYEFPYGILFHFGVLNSSPKDVAFFNLHCDVDKNLDEVYSKKSLSYINESGKFLLEKDGFKGEITLPDMPHGKFVANSYTPIFAFWRVDKYLFQDYRPKKVVLSLNYAVNNFFKPWQHFKTKTIKVKNPISPQLKTQALLLNRQWLHPMLYKIEAVQTPPSFSYHQYLKDSNGDIYFQYLTDNNEDIPTLINLSPLYKI